MSRETVITEAYLDHIESNRTSSEMNSLRASLANPGDPSVVQAPEVSPPPTPSSPSPGGDDGAVTGKWNWKLEQSIWMWNCGRTDCKLIDIIDIKYFVGVFFQSEAHLSGTVQARKTTTRFDLTLNSCAVWRDVAFSPDQHRQWWPQCKPANSIRQLFIYDYAIRGYGKNYKFYTAIALDFRDPKWSTMFGSFLFLSPNWTSSSTGVQKFY